MLKQKLTSRKFLFSLATAILLILNDGLGLGVPEELYWKIVGLVGVYVVGESIVDASRAKRDA